MAFLEVKIISALLRGIISNNHGEFYCLNYLNSYRAKQKLRKTWKGMQ